MPADDFSHRTRRPDHRVWGRVWIAAAWSLCRAADVVWLVLAWATRDRLEIAYPLLSAGIGTIVCGLMWARLSWSRAVTIAVLAGTTIFVLADLWWPSVGALRGFPFRLPTSTVVKLAVLIPLYMGALALLLWAPTVRRLVEGRSRW